jgi:hypothetical protein
MQNAHHDKKGGLSGLLLVRWRRLGIVFSTFLPFLKPFSTLVIDFRPAAV